jgi:hypothetical protein
LIRQAPRREQNSQFESAAAPAASVSLEAKQLRSVWSAPAVYELCTFANPLVSWLKQMATGLHFTAL